VSLCAAVVWAALALFLSIVPSYAADILNTTNLALLALIASIVLLASSAVQIAAQRFARGGRRDQAAGLVVLAAGLLAVVLDAPLGSLALLATGAAIAGAGHGLAFINAQQELNEIAPTERRGEVTSAFIACIYAMVAGSVVATGVLDSWFSLPVSVGAVALVLVAVPLAGAAWETREPGTRLRIADRRRSTGVRHRPKASLRSFPFRRGV